MRKMYQKFDVGSGSDLHLENYSVNEMVPLFLFTRAELEEFYELVVREASCDLCGQYMPGLDKFLEQWEGRKK